MSLLIVNIGLHHSKGRFMATSTNCTEQQLEQITVHSGKKTPFFMEAGVSSPFSEGSPTGPYSEPATSHPHPWNVFLLYLFYYNRIYV
jgi:hypothetical protein